LLFEINAIFVRLGDALICCPVAAIWLGVSLFCLISLDEGDDSQND